MANYVSVHGGMKAGAMWDEVTAILQSERHKVYCPTLPDAQTHNLNDHINEVPRGNGRKTMKKTGTLLLVLIMLLSGRTVLADPASNDMKPILEKAKVKIGNTLSNIDKDIAESARKLATIDCKSDEARKILAKMCKDRPYVFDCAIVDTNGKLSVLEPASTRKYEGNDISFEAQVKEVLGTKKPVLSKIFRCLDGTYKIDFEYPIINGKGELIGAVSLLVSHDRLLKDIITPLVKGLPYNIFVMQTDGTILYDPDPNQVNKNTFTDPMFTPFKSVASFCKSAAGKPQGSGTYEFYKRGYENKTIVKKNAIWDTASLYGTDWRIVAVEIVQK
jgi:hypothetical protein